MCETIKSKSRYLMCSNDGIESLISEKSNPDIIKRLESIDGNELTKVQLNQLLLLHQEKGISDGFFRYYWLNAPNHFYNVKKLQHFNKDYINDRYILNFDHFLWGLERIFIDTLYVFGNIRNGFHTICKKSLNELEDMFNGMRYNTEEIMARGNTLHFGSIEPQYRYLISESACKNFEDSNLKEYFKQNYKVAKDEGEKKITVQRIRCGKKNPNSKSSKNNYEETTLPIAWDDKVVEDEKTIDDYYNEIYKIFIHSRKIALKNTDYYLALVDDLDVYVATSMRDQKDFTNMSTTCEKIFKSGKLEKLDLRYFDPTISACSCHEDKGLIECLMVKSCKILIYIVGDKESWGKDAEAAMALSLGKPVIFYCDNDEKHAFFKNVHPLSRLINFKNGVACGSIICRDTKDISEIIYRIFNNDMQYIIEQKKDTDGFYQIKEALTDSMYRFQTNNKLLSSSFWNYYNIP